MASVNIYEAKTQFSKLVKRVRAGQEIIIADAGTPVAKLVPIEPPKAARVLGADRGKVVISADAFAPLSEAELVDWNRPLFPEAPRTKVRERAVARPRKRRSRR